jgi:AsmA protein
MHQRRAGRRGEFAMKAVKVVVIGLVVLLVAGSLAFALGVPAGFLMKPISNRVEAATGYRLRVAGDTRLTFWPVLTLSMHDVSVGRDGDADNGFSAQSVQVSLAPASVFSGRSEVTEIAVGHPVLRLPLLRERVSLPGARPPGRSNGEPAAAAVAARVVIDRVTIADGTIVFASRSDGVESRMEHIDLTAALAGREDAIDAKAHWDDHPVHLALKVCRSNSRSKPPACCNR